MTTRRWLYLAVLIGPLACADSPASLSAPPTGGWLVATPSSVGLDDGPLLELRRDAALGVYGDVHSLLVVRHGQLVFEEYFSEGAPDRRHRVYSVTKSVAATLVGMAWDRGLIEDTDRALLDFFPAYESLENPAGKAGITLGHALQMRTGLAWDEWATNYGDPANILTHMTKSNDWHKFVLDRPMEATPGTRFVYNTGVSHLLAGVIRRATGRPTPDFADQVLFGPMGIDDRAWWLNPDSMALTGSGLHLRSRDMARLGHLYLMRGEWDGERLLSEAWIDASLREETRFENGGGYGYQWWLHAQSPGQAPMDRAYSARGWGGQYIVVVPTLDAVIVTTQGNYDGLEGLVPERLVQILSEAAGAGS